MADRNQEGLNNIIAAINNIVEPKISNSKFDRTFRAKVIEKTENEDYIVQINNINYTLKYAGKLEPNQIVRVKAPLNNFSDIYIESLPGSGGGSGGTDDYNDLINKPILETDISENLVPDKSELIKGTIKLHKISKTGDYSDLNNKPELNFVPETEKGAVNGVATLDSNKKVSSSELPSDLVYDSSYVHTDNNFTTTLKNKLDGIESGAQVNRIEKIQRNGTELTITNKTVNIAVPTSTSDLTNNSGFITNTVNNLANYYLKTETYTQTEVNNLIGQIKTISIEVVDTLPTTGETNKIYFVPKAGETGDIYNEYIWINNSWELIGSTQVDLTGYATEDWVNSKIADFVTDAQVTQIVNNALSNYYTQTQVNNLLSVKANISDIPTKVSELENDSGYTSNAGTVTSVAVKMNGQTKGTVTSSGTIDLGTVITSHQSLDGYAKTADLATVATTGDYNDLENKPTIPAAITVDSTLSSTSTNPVQNKVINTALNDKQGKLTAGVNITISDSTISAKDTTYEVATTSVNGLMSSSDKTKLNGIASGAEVNVQSDWNISDTNSDAYIKNKPIIPAVVDNLTSTSSSDALSANQGRVLDTKVSVSSAPPDTSNMAKLWVDTSGEVPDLLYNNSNSGDWKSLLASIRESSLIDITSQCSFVNCTLIGGKIYADKIKGIVYIQVQLDIKTTSVWGNLIYIPLDYAIEPTIPAQAGALIAATEFWAYNTVNNVQVRGAYTSGTNIGLVGYYLMKR